MFSPAALSQNCGKNELQLTASKLTEIFQLLQKPGRVEAMMARFEK